MANPNRAACLRSTIPDDFEGRDTLVESLLAPTMLKRLATLDDVGNVAAFAASDHARTITAAPINISCGAIVGSPPAPSTVPRRSAG